MKSGSVDNSSESDLAIWVDADACPAPIREILFRTADRLAVHTTLVANHGIRIPASRYIRFMQVNSGFDVADNEIIRRMAPGDLVITADIPLAAEVIELDGIAISPRGELYTADNVRERLNIRDFMTELRSSGIDTGGPAAFSHRDRKAFADQLDRQLNRRQ